MAELMYSQKVAEKVFHSETTKDAYLAAVKWYASNIISKDDLHDIQVEFKKGPVGVVKITLYAVLPAKEVIQEHCAACKEIHKCFFINEANNCNVCNAGAYERRMKQKMKVKINYYQTLLSRRKLI